MSATPSARAARAPCADGACERSEQEEGRGGAKCAAAPVLCTALSRRISYKFLYNIENGRRRGGKYRPRRKKGKKAHGALLTARRWCAMMVSPLLRVYFFARIFRPKADAPPGRGGRLFNGGAERMRVKITLACTECKQRNYNTMKNKKNSPDRLEMKKYCRFCRKHTVHRETK